MKTLSEKMLAALGLVITHGPARRVRRGWCFASMDREIIAPATMEALEARGYVVAKSFAREATAAGRAAHAKAAAARTAA